ncbi:centrosomal protein 20 isoform X3 [Crotalus tigris]|uniref:centrosomal protein 20 isoform X3 n=1 Tax=Crotalus tigris TaxID=88082 RepID=UPI00192F6633|nr:centrosomal protein 20 isoform X3 [Crotalus tigris]
MATVAELKAALKEALARRGALGQVRARVRAEVFAALDDPGEPRPAAPRETLLLNELIREYLQFHRHNASASVFLAGHFCMEFSLSCYKAMKRSPSHTCSPEPPHWHLQSGLPASHLIKATKWKLLQTQNMVCGF